MPSALCFDFSTDTKFVRNFIKAKLTSLNVRIQAKITAADFIHDFKCYFSSLGLFRYMLRDADTVPYLAAGRI
jgi:hypothetical protein